MKVILEKYYNIMKGRSDPLWLSFKKMLNSNKAIRNFQANGTASNISSLEGFSDDKKEANTGIENISCYLIVYLQTMLDFLILDV